ncbi:MAG: hypothetical protein K8F92_13945 [Hyphomicrobium sp.]|uniref:hypothetical protein n=1 Tax=Hyphomicrobium sp. TaxID=82 RepID=UPI00132B697A|nr:hypothetical protein [Hyphomicrobium sp.]KAB2943492.1 MAG: hypothetical protein F9K20_02060 [Hyphomicrobium sp.]MBZ0210740.1 hypothetical protein [Hyphomicrobium sp.]
MTERLTNATVTFAHPFSLRGVQGTFPPGVYSVVVTEEQLDGLSFVAYRRVRTTIELPSTNSASLSRQLVEVVPADLEAALASDGEGG